MNFFFAELTGLELVQSPDKKCHPLAWRDGFRTFDWKKIFPDPVMVIGQIRQLLALV